MYNIYTTITNSIVNNWSSTGEDVCRLFHYENNFPSKFLSETVLLQAGS